MLRKNHHACAFLKRRHRLFERRNNPGVVVHADGVGVGENQLGQWRNDVRQQLIKPADGLGLFRPEILIGVGRHFLLVHHLTGAPDIMLAGGIQLAGDGAVHLAVVAHIHHRLRRKVLLPHDLDFGIHRLHGGFDQPVQRRNFPFSHLLLPFSGNNVSRISREPKPKINKVSFQFRFAWYTGAIIIVERTETFKGPNRIKCRGYTKKFFAPKISERECTYGKKIRRQERRRKAQKHPRDASGHAPDVSKPM